jgi:adenylate cyclase class 2
MGNFLYSSALSLIMEVEIKAPAPKGFEKRLSSLNAEFREEVIEEDIYFNHPCRDFASTDEALRIRKTIRENTEICITYKGPKIDKDTKSREEINMTVNDLKGAEDLLRKLGFVAVAEVRKKRRYYRAGTLTICVDHVDNLGDYVEVECIGTYEECRERVLNTASALGLSDYERQSYLELILQRGEA